MGRAARLSPSHDFPGKAQEPMNKDQSQSTPNSGQRQRTGSAWVVVSLVVVGLYLAALSVVSGLRALTCPLGCRLSCCTWPRRELAWSNPQSGRGLITALRAGRSGHGGRRSAQEAPLGGPSAVGRGREASELGRRERCRAEGASPEPEPGGLRGRGTEANNAR